MATRTSLMTMTSTGSTLALTVDGGPTRTFVLEGNFVDIAAVPAVPAVTTTLDDFEWIANEVLRWVRTIEGLLIKSSQGSDRRMSQIPINTEFVIGNKIGMEWDARVKVEFSNLMPDDMLALEFSYNATSSLMTFTPRPSIRLTWVALTTTNVLARELVVAAKTGVRPEYLS